MSIRAKTWVMGLAAVIGLALVFAIGFFAAGTVVEASRAGERIRAESHALDVLQVVNLELVLTGMDVIVDRGEGKVAPERVELLGTNSAKLRQGTDIVARVAAAIGRPNLGREYAASVGKLAQAATIDLVRAVEQRAPDAEFDRLDDEIDGAGDEVREILSTLSEAGQANLSNAIRNSQETASTSRWTGAVALGIGLLVLCPILYVTGRSITAELSSVAETMGAPHAPNTAAPK